MKAFLIVQNLKCNGCANTISKKVSEISTITNINIDVEASKVAFEYHTDEDVELVREKLKSIGYPSLDQTNSFTIKAKSYISCATGKFN